MNKFKFAAFADEAGSSLEAQICAMKRNGIDFLEIRGVDGKNVSDLTPSEAKEISSRLSEEGLGVWSIGSPYGKISAEDDFAPHLEKFRRSLEVCNILGASHVRLFSFFMPKDRNPLDYEGEVTERLYGFVRAAEGTGTVLCHENEKGIFGDIADRCVRIHKAVPELKAVFDPANFIQCGQDVPEAWDKLKGYVEYLHIKDALPDGKVVPSGKGIGHIKDILSEYNGKVLTIEPHLTVFAGLKGLEREGDTSNIDEFAYPTADTAFDAACNALRKIL